MIHCKPADLYKPLNVLFWMLLSMKAGYINAAGFLATGKFVSHVTGFGTQVGVSIGHDDFIFGIELLIIPLAFILGSSIPAWALDKDYDEKKVPKLHYVQVLITVGLGILFFLGVSEAFGKFSSEVKDTHGTIIIIGILCLICGMKNGLSTWATSGKIRTTHLTGLSTDIGLNLPKFFRKGNSRFPEQKRVNTVRILTFISFSIGSLISALIFPKLGFMGFIFPFGVSLFILGISYRSYIAERKRNIQEMKKLRMLKGGKEASTNIMAPQIAP